MAEPEGFRRSPLSEDPKTRFFVITSNTGENVVKSVQHNVWATQRKNEQKLNEAFRSAPAVILVFSVNKSGAFQGYARMRSTTGRSTCTSDPFNGFGRLFDIEWMRLHDLEVIELQHLRNALDEHRQVGFSRDGQELSHSVGSELCRLFDVRVYLEEPMSYEPVVDDPPPAVFSKTSALPALPAPEAPARTPGSAPMRPESLELAVHGAHGTQMPPAVSAPHPGYFPRYAQEASGRLLPEAPPGYWASGGYPSHPQAFAPGFPQYSPWGPPGFFGPGLGYMQRPERRRHRRRRRRESSSSYDSESEPRKKRRRKMRCKTQEVAEEEAPDFENMSYADYVEWWRKSHAAPGGPEGGTHAEFSSPPVAPEAPPASEAQMSAMPQSGGSVSTQPSTSPGVWVPPVGGLPEVWTSRASDTILTASQRNTGNEVGKQVQSAPFGRPGVREEETLQTCDPESVETRAPPPKPANIDEDSLSAHFEKDDDGATTSCHSDDDLSDIA